MTGVSVVIPVYNEETTLVSHLEQVLQALSEWDRDWELLVVEDGSQDQTAARLSGMSHPRLRPIFHAANRGLEAALRTGFESSNSQFVVTYDADLSYAPDLIVKLVETAHKRQADLVLASPYMPGGSVGQVPWFRLFLSRAANLLLYWASGIHCSTGMVRAYRRDSVRLPEPGQDFNLESLGLALERRAQIIEVPAHLSWRSLDRGARFSWKKLYTQVVRVLRAFPRFWAKGRRLEDGKGCP